MSLMDCTTPSTIYDKLVNIHCGKNRNSYFVLDARVFSFRVLPNQDGVDIIVGSFEALDGQARPNVSEQVECSTKSQVERDMALSD